MVLISIVLLINVSAFCMYVHVHAVHVYVLYMYIMPVLC